MKKLALLALAATLTTAPALADSLLNVSYDPTRELYVDINAAFAKVWKAKTGHDLTVRQSHGGSGKQARAVIDGLDADVATLALSYDIDEIANHGLTDKNWQKRLPQNSTPYYSTIVFLVRQGNPKHIKDWNDLIKPGVGVIAPNPKTGGSARWIYLAGWGYAKRAYKSDAKAEEYVKRFYKNVLVLDSGARGSTTTFLQRGQGDVLVNWENEAKLAVQEASPGKYQIVYPSVSILAEPPVAVIDKNAQKHGTTQLANAYLRYLYTPEAQNIIAHDYYRPRNPQVAARYKASFPALKLFTVADDWGSWTNAQQKNFNDGGTFDRIYQPGN